MNPLSRRPTSMGGIMRRLHEARYEVEWTRRGIERHLQETVAHLRNVRCEADLRRRGVVIVRLWVRDYVLIGLGLWHLQIKRAVRRALEPYRPAAVAVEIKFHVHDVPAQN